MKGKRVAVQEGLHEAAKLLKEKGYQVTTIDNADEAIDVIVYSGKNQKYLAHNMTGNIGVKANNNFVKMINLDEISMQNLISNIEELE